MISGGIERECEAGNTETKQAVTTKTKANKCSKMIQSKSSNSGLL